MAPVDATKFLALFKHESSAVDWCERNYVVVPAIAEFWNTVSSLIYFFIPLTTMTYHWLTIGNDACKFIALMSGLSVSLIGVGSVYFHSTLSYVGQLLDEVSIVWLVFLFYGVVMPKKYVARLYGQETFTRKMSQNFGRLVTAACFITTVACFIKPALNNFLLFVFLPPKFYIIYMEMKLSNCERHKHTGRLFILLFSVAFICWISDRAMCPMWRSLGFPYLHAIWHVLNCIGGYCCILFFTFLKCKEEKPQQRISIEFWPKCGPKVFAQLPYILTTNVEMQNENVCPPFANYNAAGKDTESQQVGKFAGRFPNNRQTRQAELAL